jgi:restriction system protein
VDAENLFISRHLSRYNVRISHNLPAFEFLQNKGILAGIPLVRILFIVFSVASLIAAGVSAIKSVSRRKLLDRQDGIESLRRLSWQEFEQLVGEAYRRQGYDIEETGGGGADGGIDLLLRGNNETVVVQCKQWKTYQVGVDKVRELLGVVSATNASRGVLVSSGSFTNDAKSFAANNPITLVDGPALAKLVTTVQTQRGSTQTESMATSPASTGAVNCPRCGADMVLRTAKRGANAGARFYGCSQFPDCNGIREI